MIAESKDGDLVEIELKDVQLCPMATANLISMSQAADQGCMLHVTSPEDVAFVLPDDDDRARHGDRGRPLPDRDEATDRTNRLLGVPCGQPARAVQCGSLRKVVKFFAFWKVHTPRTLTHAQTTVLLPCGGPVP